MSLQIIHELLCLPRLFICNTNMMLSCFLTLLNDPYLEDETVFL